MLDSTSTDYSASGHSTWAPGRSPRGSVVKRGLQANKARPPPGSVSLCNHARGGLEGKGTSQLGGSCCVAEDLASGDGEKTLAFGGNFEANGKASSAHDRIRRAVKPRHEAKENRYPVDN